MTWFGRLLHCYVYCNSNWPFKTLIALRKNNDVYRIAIAIIKKVLSSHLEKKHDDIGIGIYVGDRLLPLQLNNFFH